MTETLRASQPLAKPFGAARLPRSRRPLRVLVVDGEPAHRDYVRLLLRERPDVQVVGEAGGYDATLPLLDALRPDVALVDMLSPGVNGFQVAHRLRTAAPHVRTIVTGGEDGAQFHAMARAAGAAGFVSRRRLSADAIVHLAN